MLILYITAKTIQGFDDLAGSGIYGQVTQLENYICGINNLTVPGLKKVSDCIRTCAQLNNKNYHHLYQRLPWRLACLKYQVLSTKCSSVKPALSFKTFLFPFEVSFIFRDEHLGKVSEVRLEIIFLSF